VLADAGKSGVATRRLTSGFSLRRMPGSLPFQLQIETWANRSMDMSNLEEGTELVLDFTKIDKIAAGGGDVIPVAVQHADTKEVILIAYTNELAFRKSIETRSLVLWSTSRNELWEKGKTSGETFDLIEAFVNCEQNSLVYRVRPRRGNICHTKNRAGQPRNCYYRRIHLDTQELENLDP
jgi:phosphoribosyl-AMP cyclohydrolase